MLQHNYKRHISQQQLHIVERTYVRSTPFLGLIKFWDDNVVDDEDDAFPWEER